MEISFTTSTDACKVDGVTVIDSNDAEVDELSAILLNGKIRITLDKAYAAQEVTYERNVRLSYEKIDWELETDGELTHRYNHIPLTVNLITNCAATLFTFTNEGLPSQFSMEDGVPYAEIVLLAGQSFEVNFSGAIVNENAE